MDSCLSKLCDIFNGLVIVSKLRSYRSNDISSGLFSACRQVLISSRSTFHTLCPSPALSITFTSITVNCRLSDFFGPTKKKKKIPGSGWSRIVFLYLQDLSGLFHTAVLLCLQSRSVCQYLVDTFQCGSHLQPTGKNPPSRLQTEFSKSVWRIVWEIFPRDSQLFFVSPLWGLSSGLFRHPSPPFSPPLSSLPLSCSLSSICSLTSYLPSSGRSLPPSQILTVCSEIVLR